MKVLVGTASGLESEDPQFESQLRQQKKRAGRRGTFSTLERKALHERRGTNAGPGGCRHGGSLGSKVMLRSTRSSKVSKECLGTLLRIFLRYPQKCQKPQKPVCGADMMTGCLARSIDIPCERSSFQALTALRQPLTANGIHKKENQACKQCGIHRVVAEEGVRLAHGDCCSHR